MFILAEVNRVRMILKSQNRPVINEKDENDCDNGNTVKELIQVNVFPNI